MSEIEAMIQQAVLEAQDRVTQVEALVQAHNNNELDLGAHFQQAVTNVEKLHEAMQRCVELYVTAIKSLDIATAAISYMAGTDALESVKLIEEQGKETGP